MGCWGACCASAFLLGCSLHATFWPLPPTPLWLCNPQMGHARSAIHTDGTTLASVFDQHQNIGSSVSKARKVRRGGCGRLAATDTQVPRVQVLSRIQRQDELDRWLMLLANAVFILVSQASGCRPACPQGQQYLTAALPSGMLVNRYSPWWW